MFWERIFLQFSYSFFGSLPYRRIIDNGLSNFHIIVSNTQKDPVFCHQPKKPQGSFAVVCFVVGYIKSYTVGILDFSHPLNTFGLFRLSAPYYSAQANKKGTIWKLWSWAFRIYLETRPQPQYGLSRGRFPKVIGNLGLGLEQRPLDLWRPTIAQR